MYCRHIDTVNVKGSKLDLKLYTVDVDVDVLPPSGTK